MFAERGAGLDLDRDPYGGSTARQAVVLHSTPNLLSTSACSTLNDENPPPGRIERVRAVVRRGAAPAVLFVAVALSLIVGLWLWLPWHDDPNRSSDLGSEIIGGLTVGSLLAAAVWWAESRRERQAQELAVQLQAFSRQENLRLRLGMQRDFPGIDLSGYDLSGFYLSGKNFARAMLNGADLRDTFLSDADLKGATLTRTDLRNALLVGADLTGASLYQADLRHASLDSACLMNATLFGADLRDAHLSRASLKNAVLSLARLEGAFIVEADLSGTHIDGVDFDRAEIAGANFRGAVIQRSSFEGAVFSREDLTGPILDGATYDEATTRWPEGFDPQKAGATVGKPHTETVQNQDGATE
jgi:uncharacterized protein YjbI with pentapeptide repeats